MIIISEQKDFILSKLEILVNKQMIKVQDYEKLKLIYQYFIKLKFDDQNLLEVFITHLAMVLYRNYHQEQVAIIDKKIQQEIVNSEYYLEAKQIDQIIKNYLELEIDEKEWDYINLHLINLLTQREI